MPSDRLFIPPRIGDSTIGDIVFRQDRRAFSNLRKRRGGEVKVGRHIAVNVGGACYGNGKPWARAAAGVYFGPWSRHNFSEEVEDGRQTNQRAEIYAAIIALDKIKEFLDEEKLNTSLVVVVTDSRYVVDAMTNFIYRWQDNGWRNRKRSEVVNREDFEELDELVDELEDDYEVFVKFWWVPKEDNEDADEMARQAAGFYDDDDDDDDDSD
ncbi:Ribonuclease H1 [Leucoagaricus sp. SymC.cos]|nr:Ribonuclease H1 [Leucoagaricus sp. SymC.cos]